MREARKSAPDITAGRVYTEGVKIFRNWIRPRFRQMGGVEKLHGKIRPRKWPTVYLPQIGNGNPSGALSVWRATASDVSRYRGKVDASPRRPSGVSVEKRDRPKFRIDIDQTVEKVTQIGITALIDLCF